MAAETLPLPSRNCTYTVLVPSPFDSVHAATAANGWNAEYVTPSLLRRTSVTPDVGAPGSPAARFRVTAAEVADPAPPLIATEPVGGVPSVSMSSDQPARAPSSSAKSSTAYRLHTPFGFVPLNADRAVFPLSAGAGESKRSGAPGTATSVGR